LRTDNFVKYPFLLAERLFADRDFFERTFSEDPAWDAQIFFELFVLAYLDFLEVPLVPDLISDVFLCAAAIISAKLLDGVELSDAYFLAADALCCPANKSVLKNAAQETNTKVVANSKVRMV